MENESNSDSAVPVETLEMAVRSGEGSQLGVIKEQSCIPSSNENTTWPIKRLDDIMLNGITVSLANSEEGVDYNKLDTQEPIIHHKTRKLKRLKRLLKYSNFEKRMGYCVMFVIVLDTSLLAFESDNPNVASPMWVVVMSWLFLFVYIFEIGYRLWISVPTIAFFRKRFYVFDFLVVAVCAVMQVASALPSLASAIRAIRLARLLRILRMLRVLRIFTRVMEIWHDCNMKNMQVKESILRINLQLNVGNFKLHRMLSQHDFFETVDDVDGGMTLMGQKKDLDVQDLFTIAELLKEEEDQDLFRCEEFCLEWLMLLVLWTSFIIGLSWAFVVIEADNYDLVIQENHDIKLSLDNAVPVRDKLEVVLTALASCEGNLSEVAYNLLADVSTEYSNPNVTMWNELDSLLGAYTFYNPWTFEGSTFFTITIATTIGYGTFTPLTSTGKQIVIFCSLPAIYLTIVFGQKNMELLQKGFCRTQYESLGLMGFFSVIFLLSFMLVGGWILTNSEGWTMWDSIYFCWVSFSTIGFGDYAPVVTEEWNVVFLSLVVVGWNIVIFVISVIDKLSTEFKGMSWWNENKFQPMATIANTLRIEQKAASNLIGVAQVVYSANSSSAAELSLEIEKCEQRLLHLKQEQKNLALKDECEGSMRSPSLSNQMIISLEDVHLRTKADEI